MVHVNKTELRTILRSRRADIGDSELNHASAGLRATGLDLLAELDLEPERQGVAAYLPVGSEPPILGLLEVLYQAGHRVLVPICEADYQLSWVDWHPGIALQRSPRAWVDEPIGPRFDISVMAQIRLLLIPALAVDHTGNRLGQGGGYYDRFLTALAQTDMAPRRVAVIFTHELIAEGTLPAERFDQPVQYALTPEFFRALEC